MSSSELEADVLRGVTDVFYDYAEAADACDAVAFAALFTDDCVFDGGRPSRGRDRIERHAATVLANFRETSHHITQIRVRSFDGRDAKVSAYVCAFHRLADGNTFTAFARYYSTLRVDDGRWRFAEHSIVLAANVGSDGREYLRLQRGAPVPPVV